LIYLRNRYYDPATGKFTQEDPIGLAGGLNLYGFAGGDPINFSDPFGLRHDEEGDGSETDKERFARFVEQLAASTESDAEFVDALAGAVLGAVGGNPETADPGRSTVSFGASGFRPDLVDDANPVRHYVANLAAGFRWGGVAGDAIAIVREAPPVCQVGCSVADVRLGVLGAQHGSRMTIGKSGALSNYGIMPASRKDLAGWIRRQL
jgi:hypothetical protein